MMTLPAPSKNFQKLILVLLPLVLLFAPFREVVCGELSGSLHAISQAPVDSRVQVLVFFDTDNNAAFSKASLNQDLGRTRLHELTYNGLKNNSKYYSERFADELRDSRLDATVLENYWITEAALVEVNSFDLEALSSLEGVSFIAPDTTLSLIKPVDESPSISLSGTAGYNLHAIKADKLWARGLTGQGRLLGSIDTGVKGDHPALASKWQGNYTTNFAAGWFDPYGSTFPEDNNGHGTHVMGIMVGIENDDTIGVAFNAHWISAAVIDRGSGLSKTISDILSAFEWLADPDGDPATISDVPDAVNHSWGIPQGIFPDCDNTFWDAIDNLEDLGIVCIFSAGNEGPDDASMRNPADRATGPLNAFAVGAVDAENVIASFSSRGPSTCDENEIKPEVVAPGVSIRSTSSTGGYKLMSGTSMAAPHLTAAVALMREYNPEATSQQIKQALYESAVDLGDPGEDNAYGNGLVDLEAALALIPPPDDPQIEINSFAIEDGNDQVVTTGEQFELSLNVTSHYAGSNDLWARIFIPETYANIISDSSYFGDVALDESGSNESNPFVIVLNEVINPGTRMPVDINFYSSNSDYSFTKRLEVVIAQTQTAGFYTLSNGEVEITVDNFGGIGHGPNSLGPTFAPGFIPYDETDILPEFSLLIAGDRNENVSDAARTADGFISDNDFMASREQGFVSHEPGSFGSMDLYGTYNDSLAGDPLGLSIRQRTSLFDQSELKNAVIIEYAILSENSFPGDELYVGFLSDFDLGIGGSGVEMTAFDTEGDFSYYYNQDHDLYVGIRFLNQSVYSNKILYNVPGTKSALTEAAKYDYMTSGVINDGVDKFGDYFSVISSRVTVESYDSITIAVAVVIGRSLEELSVSMNAAYSYYNISTDVADEGGDPVVPSAFELAQNYPNPFNMATNISFTLPTSGQVKLDVYNLLGQKVAILAEGEYPAGTVTINWDGKDRSGHDLASGAYFYRLVVDGNQIDSRKLMILK